MERLMIKDLFVGGAQYDGKIVTVCGWAKTIRDSKVFGFIELNVQLLQKFASRVRARTTRQLRRNCQT